MNIIIHKIAEARRTAGQQDPLADLIPEYNSLLDRTYHDRPANEDAIRGII